mgnify:CR=1 FL=1
MGCWASKCSDDRQTDARPVLVFKSLGILPRVLADLVQNTPALPLSIPKPCHAAKWAKKTNHRAVPDTSGFDSSHRNLLVSTRIHSERILWPDGPRSFPPAKSETDSAFLPRQVPLQSPASASAPLLTSRPPHLHHPSLTRPSFHPRSLSSINFIVFDVSHSLPVKLHFYQRHTRYGLSYLHRTALHSDSRSVEERRHTGQHVHQVRDIVSRNAASPLFETNKTVDPSDQPHHRRLIILIPSIPLVPRYLSRFERKQSERCAWYDLQERPPPHRVPPGSSDENNRVETGLSTYE